MCAEKSFGGTGASGAVASPYLGILRVPACDQGSKRAVLDTSGSGKRGWMQMVMEEVAK